VRGFINAAEPFTALTGSLMAREVAEAWDYAVPKYVRLDELHDAIGRRIASLIGCEAAMVTSGAAAALTLATAACMTGADRDKIRRLSDTNGTNQALRCQFSSSSS
jgi:L-seryl-tRNA(Ser) seleniumtransferase